MTTACADHDDLRRALRPISADSRLILQLFLQLAQPSFTPAELAAFIALFKEPQPPLVSEAMTCWCDDEPLR